MDNQDQAAEKALRPSPADWGHTAVAAILSLVPGAAEFFSFVVTAPLSKRRDAFIISLYHRLVLLEKQVEGFRIEDLRDNDVFQTAVAEGMLIAARTSSEKKLDALRNIVLRTALPEAPDEATVSMLLGTLAGLNEWHLAIMNFLDDPEGDRHLPTGTIQVDEARRTAATIYDYLEMVYPELKDRTEFVYRILRELSAADLAMTETVPSVAYPDQRQVSLSAHDPHRVHIPYATLSLWGKTLLDFTKEPILPQGIDKNRSNTVT
jgi:hypothetical protein